MNRAELAFVRPAGLEATAPPELRGLARDGVRLMVSSPRGHTHAHFRDLAAFLRPGDLLVVNRSATLPASLPAQGRPGSFIVNLSTFFGDGVWLAEPRWGPGQPGPLPLHAGEQIDVGGVRVKAVASYPDQPRLWFIRAEGSLDLAMSRAGSPIRYGYVIQDYPLDLYQTLFACVPGSAEMPSAGRPFTLALMDSLAGRGIRVAEVVLHAGVSSLEMSRESVEADSVLPEPFWVFAATAEAVNAARRDGRRVIAVGTTVFRALESAWDGRQVRASTGFTRVYLNPGRPAHVVDSLITGFHDPATSHLALLYALADPQLIRSAYDEAVHEKYLWHEFGDSHLILTRN